VDLVAVLRQQHQARRRLTESIRSRATLSVLKNSEERRQLEKALSRFFRMYRPHEARENTVLFPAFRSIVSPQEYGALGEEFEDKEHQLFGEEGFDQTVDAVAKLERVLGTYDLAQFTPNSLEGK